jgi:ribosomal protein S18 acetylase RimI-like enzyme
LVDSAIWAGLTLAAGVIAPADPLVGHALVAAGLRDGLRVTVAVEGTTVVGAALSRHADGAARADLLALGVAPGWRRRGLAGHLLAAHIEGMRPGDVDLAAEVAIAERDPLDPLDGTLRRAIARRLLEAAGFSVVPADGPVRAADPAAIAAVRPGLPVGS